MPLTIRQQGYNVAVETISGYLDMPREALEKTKDATVANVTKYKLLGFTEDAVSFAEGLAEGCEDMLRVM